MIINVDFIPREQSKLYLWARNLILKIILWATDIQFDALQMDKPLHVELLPGQKLNYWFGLLPGAMPVKIVNTSIATVNVNCSIAADDSTIGANPVVSTGGQTANTTIILLGGDLEGNHYFNFGNQSNIDPASLILYIPRYGHLIMAASKIIFDIDYTNALTQTLEDENANKEANRITETAFLRGELA